MVARVMGGLQPGNGFLDGGSTPPASTISNLLLSRWRRLGLRADLTRMPRQSFFGPIVGEEFSGLFRAKANSEHLRSVSEDRVGTLGQVSCRRQNNLIRDNARVFEAFSVGHDEIRFGDLRPVKDDESHADFIGITLRFHHASRGAVAQDNAALLVRQGPEGATFWLDEFGGSRSPADSLRPVVASKAACYVQPRR